MICQSPEWEISKKFLEIEDFLDKDQQNLLIKYFLHPSFPWALTVDAVQGIGENIDIQDHAAIGLFHTFIYNGQLCSEYFSKIDHILNNFESLKLDVKKLFRIRAGLFFKNPDITPHVCHVDATIPHTTAVYYVNDCDGDLIIFNETYKSHPYKKPEFPEEMVRFKPSKGKLVLFDGQHYHSSSYPTQKPLRLAITFNFSL